MATETIYIVQSWQKGKRGVLVADAPTSYRSEEEAVRRAGRLAEERSGVMAFAQTADAEVGDYSEPLVLFTAGQVPEMA